MFDHNTKQALKLGAAYIALVIGIVMFFIVCSTPASAHPKFDTGKQFKYVAVCEMSDVTRSYYSNDVTTGGYQEGFVMHYPYKVNAITGETTKLGKRLELSRSRCFLLQRS